MRLQRRYSEPKGFLPRLAVQKRALALGKPHSNLSASLYFLDIQINPLHFFLTGAPPRAENLLSQFICATRLAWRFEEGRSELLLPYMATLSTLILQQTPTKRSPLSPTQCCQVQLPAIVSSVLVAVDTVEVEVDIELLLLAASVL